MQLKRISCFLLFIVFSSNVFVPTAFTLLTFDVDGTLVQGGGTRGKAAEQSAHSRSYSIAIGKLFGDGVNPVAPVAKTIPLHQYHGSTDGLILLRLARAALGVEPSEAYKRLDELMEEMYKYISSLSDKEVARGILPLPGVLETLSELSAMNDRVVCGLVTGNVEGIARRKMRAVGIWETGALAPPSKEQLARRWIGTEEIGFLGGFGSDYCSGRVDEESRNYLDRAEQIAIATRRCIDTYPNLNRVVHVGDAPSDVLAAKAFAQRRTKEYVLGGDMCVGMVAVATGSYGAELLRELAGEPLPGKWEPVILDNGMADRDFLQACGIER